jgi:hypothetical protein
MKIKTSELTGAALDWAVARCECGPDDITQIDDPHFYSTDWAQGGPIIEREQITIGADGEGWCAGKPWDTDWMSGFVHRGDTPLIAAMRCYVASKLGDTVEVPEELA